MDIIIINNEKPKLKYDIEGNEGNIYSIIIRIKSFLYAKRLRL